MRAIRQLIPLLFCVVTFIFAQEDSAQAPKRAAIKGIVVESKSGEPVGKTVVILLGSSERRVGAISDKDGKFEFRDLEPGAYRVEVERTGYVLSRESERQTVTVEAGEKGTDLNVTLVRSGAVSGSIVDAEGDPVTGAYVHLRPLRKQRESRSLTGGSTNDRGEYRVFGLPPGDYQAQVTYESNLQRLEIRFERDISTNYSYPTVYYPGTLDAG